MKALILVSAWFLFSTGQTTVYVCVSPSAKKYHYSKSCAGLQRCTHEIREISEKEAKEAGYTGCLKE